MINRLHLICVAAAAFAAGCTANTRAPTQASSGVESTSTAAPAGTSSAAHGSVITNQGFDSAGQPTSCSYTPSQIPPPCPPPSGPDQPFQAACQSAGYQVLACDQCGLTSLCSGDVAGAAGPTTVTHEGFAASGQKTSCTYEESAVPPPCPSPQLGSADQLFQQACAAAGYQVLACDQCGGTSLCSGEVSGD